MGSRTLRTRYGYEAATGRYRNLTTGRYVSEADVMRLMQAEIDSSMERMRDLLAAAQSGETPYTIADWQRAMANELRQVHGEMLMLSVGGRNNVTAEDWGSLGLRLRDEYAYLNGFANDIAGGLSDAQIDARMQMYADASWNSFWHGKTDAMERAGFSEERRILDPQAETCGDCEGYAARGWQPMGTLPEPGEKSQCLRRCRCRKVYRKSQVKAA